MLGEVTTLEHEVLDDAVEAGSLVAVVLLAPLAFDANRELTEVPCCFRDICVVEVEHNSLLRLAADRDVKL